MDNIELKDICFDKEDALLFTYNDDFMLKARAIQNSILPKLDALVRKSLNRIEEIYGISVFEEKSHHIYWPHFRENRINDLKTDYENAGSGISASRLKIWTKLNRDDNKDVTIIPVSLYYRFWEDGIMIQFAVDNRISHLTIESFRKLFTVIYENIDYLQAFASAFDFKISVGNEYIDLKSEDQLIPLTNRLKAIIDSDNKNNYYFYCTKIYKLPFNAEDNIEVLNDFSSMFPFYYEILLLAQNKKSQINKLIPEFKKYYSEFLNEGKDNSVNKEKKTSIDYRKVKSLANKYVDAIGIRAGIRWQVFERDDFKCVACGLSVKDGAILHVDHIIPRSKGGGDSMENYQTLCQKCNIGKSNKSKRNLRN